MTSPSLHLLQSDAWQVGILPETGASVAFGRVRYHGQWLDFMRPTPETSYGHAPECASYTLIPWSNRIRDGKFIFRGQAHTLKVNNKDGTAIHGVARDYPWQVEVVESNKVFVNFHSDRFQDVNFPWRFSTRIDYRVDKEYFTVTTWLKNEDSTPMPAGFGHHPYFMRSLSGPTDAVELELPCTQMFQLENCLPSAGPIPVEPRVDFRKIRPLGDVFIDDCLTGRIDNQPIRFAYNQSGKRFAMHFDNLYQNIVFYVPQQGKPFFAVEPVTNANDGFNLHEKGIARSGVFVLEPGQERQATFTLQIEN